MLAGQAERSFTAGLLHYRPWQGTLRGPSGYEPIVFLALQVGLLILIGTIDSLQMPPVVSENVGNVRPLGLPLHRPELETPEISHEGAVSLLNWAWPVLRLLSCAALVLSWGIVVRSRAWPIARVSLVMLFRRRLFWVIYGLALMVFLLFFFGQYLMAWATTQLGEGEVRVGGMGRANPRWLVDFFRNALKLNGSAETFRNFFWYEGYNVMIVLALAGAILVGNDLRFGSLPFYLARPISRWDYLLGKGLAVAVFINLLTTAPAVLLFVQFGMLESWDYFYQQGHLLVGILAYGLVTTLSLTCILLATATWLQRTVPLIMTWTTLFFFCRLLSTALVEGLHFDARWRLIDLWNSLYLLGNVCLRVDPALIRPAPQPAWYEAALVLGGVSTLCLSYLILRIRAVEIVK